MSEYKRNGQFTDPASGQLDKAAGAQALGDDQLEQSSGGVKPIGGGAAVYGTRWKCKECGWWNKWGPYVCQKCGAEKASDCEVQTGWYIP